MMQNYTFFKVQNLWGMEYFSKVNLWEMEYFDKTNLWEMDFLYLCAVKKTSISWRKESIRERFTARY